MLMITGSITIAHRLIRLTERMAQARTNLAVAGNEYRRAVNERKAAEVLSAELLTGREASKEAPACSLASIKSVTLEWASRVRRYSLSASLIFSMSSTSRTWESVADGSTSAARPPVIAHS